MYRGRARTALVLVLLGTALCCAVGCRTTEENVERWGSTKNGPDKLVAVLTHDKYEPALRAHAALTLISMKLRGGRREGIDRLLAAYPLLSEPERAALNQRVIPAIISELKRPVPAPDKDGKRAADPSIPFKDAASALLASERPPLLNDQERSQLAAALGDWAFEGFSERVDAPAQRIDMLRLLKQLGPESVRNFPQLVKADAPKLARAVQVIAEVGSAETKREAAARVIEIANDVDSKKWLQAQEKLVMDANAQAGSKVVGKRLEAQLLRFQEEELIRLFSHLKRLGGELSVGYLIGYAANPNHPHKAQVAALASLQGLIPKGATKPVDQLLTLAGDTKTDTDVRALALRLVGEQPRDKIADKLFALFDSKDWRIRQAAGELLLILSKQSDLSEFMARLGKVSDLCVAEPLRYGRLLGPLKGKQKPLDLVRPYLSVNKPVAVRLAALGYYYAHADADAFKAVVNLEQDPTPTPSCRKDAEACHWLCSEKSVRTVGDFVRYCVKPEVEARAAAAKVQAPQPSPKKPAGPGAKASPAGEKNQ